MQPTMNPVEKTQHGLSKAQNKNDSDMMIRISKASDTNSPRDSGKFSDTGAQLAKMKQALSTSDQVLQKKDKEIKLLKEDLERRKQAEIKMLESFAVQTKQLEQTKILLEETKAEIASLREKLNKPEGGHDRLNASSELEFLREKLARVEEAERSSSFKVVNLLEEIRQLKHDVKKATEAEERSNKAMEDLALALKEVAMDCNQTKEKLIFKEADLEAARLECRQLDEKLTSAQENYQTLFQESRKEKELHKNTMDRLRGEAEESALAWNDKEAVFVSCIKVAEDEKDRALEENETLLNALMAEEETTKKAREENHKLRDILKQAINEANIAKEAAGIARAENSRLQDALSDKEEALNFLVGENQSLKQNEVAANESINELKRLLNETSRESSRTSAGEKENKKQMSRQHSGNQEVVKKSSSQTSAEKESRVADSGSALREINVPNRNTEKKIEDGKQNEDSSRESDSDWLQGSISDMKESRTPNQEATNTHNGKNFPEEEGETLTLEDLEPLEVSENEKSARKRRALLRKFGDLLGRKKGLHKSNSSMEL